MYSSLEPIINSEKGRRKVSPAETRRKNKVTGHRKIGLAIFQNLRMNKQN